MNTKSSAQLEERHFEESATATADSTALLRRQVAERLAAHRARRTGNSAAPLQSPVRRELTRPSNPIAATVAARYAQSPSYRAFLAEEARHAIERADAAAEVAARNAEAVAAVQLQLLDDLRAESAAPPVASAPDRPAGARKAAVLTPFPVPEPKFEPAVDAAVASEPTGEGRISDASRADLKERVLETFADGLDNAAVRVPEIGPLHDEPAPVSPADADSEFHLQEPPAPPIPIPANLLTFPRPMVAARKARPRLAEGPLRDAIDGYDAHLPPPGSQLRIFEVASVETVPEPVEPAEWNSIWLDTPTEAPLRIDEVETAAPEPTQREVAAQAPSIAPYFAPVAPAALTPAPARPAAVPVHAACLSHRLLAATMDAALVFGGTLAAVTATALATGPSVQLPPGPESAMIPTAIFVAFYVLYHLLFFTLSDGTPGMQYARIGLCTFEDESPTRAELRRRLWATLIAAFPLGLGVLWALLDDEGLGWHDRMSRIYPRSY